MIAAPPISSAMRRVLIIGPCGAGKSTLSMRLSELLDLPVIHLDALNWQAGWVMTPNEEFEQKVLAVSSGERWIIDGNYSRTLGMRAQRADMIIMLDYPRWLCIWRVIKRIIRFHGLTRPDMGEGCPERLDWEFIEYVWNFHSQHRPRMLRRVETISNEKKVIVFHHPHEAETFINALAQGA